MTSFADLRRLLYDFSPPDSLWLQSICEVLVDAMNLPAGAALRLMSLPDGEGVEVSCGALLASAPLTDWVLLLGRHRSESRGVVEPYVTTLKDELVASELPPEIEHMGRRLVVPSRGDVLALSCPVDHLTHLVFAAPWPEAVQIRGARLRRWRWLAVHLSVASRLRNLHRRNDSDQDGSVDKDSWLDRGASSYAAVPEGPEVWSKLVDGSLSVHRSFSGAGLRVCVLGPRGDHATSQGLTPRQAAVLHLAGEGHPNKVIAYRLGISGSTVASHVTRGLSRLGLESRLEWVQLFQQLVNDGEEQTDTLTSSPPDFSKVEAALAMCVQELSGLSPSHLDIIENRQRVLAIQRQIVELRQTLLAAGLDD